MSKIKFLKIRNVKNPTRANSSDSGIDFFIPNDLTEIKLTPTTGRDKNLELANIENWKIDIPSSQWVLIPAWVKTIIEEWYDLVFENKSWVSTKYWLVIWAKVVDSSYRWEVHIHLINTSDKTIQVELWQKVAQGIIRKVENDIPEEISEEEFSKHENTDRWNWWFGSTGEK